MPPAGNRKISGYPPRKAIFVVLLRKTTGAQKHSPTPGVCGLYLTPGEAIDTVPGCPRASRRDAPTARTYIAAQSQTGVDPRKRRENRKIPQIQKFPL